MVAHQTPLGSALRHDRYPPEATVPWRKMSRNRHEPLHGAWQLAGSSSNFFSTAATLSSIE